MCACVLCDFLGGMGFCVCFFFFSLILSVNCLSSEDFLYPYSQQTLKFTEWTSE